MPAQIKMPQQSDTMTEGTVVKWLKNEGDKIKAGETVAEIETDKAVMEMESSTAGTLAAVVVPAGQKVPVGTVLALIATGSENPADVKKQGGESAAPKAAAPAPSTAAAAPASGGASAAASSSGAAASAK